MKSAEGTNDWAIGRFDDFEFLIFEFVWSASWRIVLGIWDLFVIWCLEFGIFLLILVGLYLPESNK
jgi:hypothetical protein